MHPLLAAFDATSKAVQMPAIKPHREPKGPSLAEAKAEVEAYGG